MADLGKIMDNYISLLQKGDTIVFNHGTERVNACHFVSGKSPNMFIGEYGGKMFNFHYKNIYIKAEI